MKNILFVCDFSSIHSRNLVRFFKEKTELNVSVLSSFAAPEMEGVKLLILMPGAIGDKESLQKISTLILKLSPMLYRWVVAFLIARKTKKLIKIASEISLSNPPDIIHALRTQPEGIIANTIFNKYPVTFYLTTWGQDFILWAKLSFWLKKKTIQTVKNTSYIFPDNYRDDYIIKNIYGIKKHTLVLPATGGLDLKYLKSINTKKIPHIKGDLNFLSTRGYENAYVKLSKILQTFKKISSQYPQAHLYIDLHQKVNISKDQKITTWIEKHNLSKKVTLLHLSREDMFAYMSQCRFHVSATFSDGLPLSLLESLYFGQIPIVFNHESTQIIEKEFQYYFSFNSYQISDIEKAWRKAINSDGPTQEILKNKNRKVIEERYERAKNLEKIMKIYQKN